METNISIVVLFVLQMVYAYTATKRVTSIIRESAFTYVRFGILNDAVKYGITAILAVQAVNGDWIVIATTILGGAIGNAIGHARSHN